MGYKTTAIFRTGYKLMLKHGKKAVPPPIKPKVVPRKKYLIWLRFNIPALLYPIISSIWVNAAVPQNIIINKISKGSGG